MQRRAGRQHDRPSRNQDHTDGRSETVSHPPRTLTISAVLPPSSETGITCATCVVYFLSSAQSELKPVPPEKATSLCGCGRSARSAGLREHMPRTGTRQGLNYTDG